MRLYVHKKGFSAGRLIISAVLFTVLLAVFIFAAGAIGRRGESSWEQSARDAMYRAAASCYAVEGFYPDSLQYLEQNYGVIINHEKYVVNYQYAGENIMPYIELVLKGQG